MGQLLNCGGLELAPDDADTAHVESGRAEIATRDGQKNATKERKGNDVLHESHTAVRSGEGIYTNDNTNEEYVDLDGSGRGHHEDMFPKRQHSSAQLIHSSDKLIECGF